MTNKSYFKIYLTPTIVGAQATATLRTMLTRRTPKMRMTTTRKTRTKIFFKFKAKLKLQLNVSPKLELKTKIKTQAPKRRIKIKTSYDPAAYTESRQATFWAALHASRTG